MDLTHPECGGPQLFFDVVLDGKDGTWVPEIISEFPDSPDAIQR